MVEHSSIERVDWSNANPFIRLNVLSNASFWEGSFTILFNILVSLLTRYTRSTTSVKAVLFRRVIVAFAIRKKRCYVLAVIAREKNAIVHSGRGNKKKKKRGEGRSDISGTRTHKPISIFSSLTANSFLSRKFPKENSHAIRLTSKRRMDISLTFRF